VGIRLVAVRLQPIRSMWRHSVFYDDVTSHWRHTSVGDAYHSYRQCGLFSGFGIWRMAHISIAQVNELSLSRCRPLASCTTRITVSVSNYIGSYFSTDRRLHSKVTFSDRTSTSSSMHATDSTSYVTRPKSWHHTDNDTDYIKLSQELSNILQYSVKDPH